MTEPSRGAASSKPSADALAPGLYVVATPIGNLGDMAPRAREVLSAADVVACEDSRTTGKLAALLGLTVALKPYHEHNAARVRPQLIERLKRGESVALVSDAGTPLVSDPGYKLVRACVEEGLPVTAVPGPSAVTTALMVAGLPTDRFLFAGFLPVKAGARRQALTELAAVPATLVIMESPRRLADSLADMAGALGPREAAVTRELTKLNEEVRRGALPDLAAHYAESGAPKGEVTIVVGPPAAAEAPDAATVDRLLRAALAELSLRDAAARVAAETGLPRRQVYGRALALAGKDAPA